MNALRCLPALLALGALCACPGTAAAASLVPPGNSAANQYTETFPTTGGNAEAEGKRKGGATPREVLGDRNAMKLDSQGRQGRETAAVLAATAPPVSASIAGGGGDGNDPAVAGSGSDEGGGGGSGSVAGTAAAADAEGSSGLGEVLGQATGSSSSDGIGLLLPLIVIASVVWALAFFLRRRRRTA